MISKSYEIKAQFYAFVSLMLFLAYGIKVRWMHRWRVKKKRETAHKANMLEQEKKHASYED